MKQPTKNNHQANKIKKSDKPKHKKEYGTSKLEEKFAKDFLDNLGIKYEYQFKAEDIERYYDFLLKTDNGGKVLLELDGDYW